MYLLEDLVQFLKCLLIFEWLLVGLRLCLRLFIAFRLLLLLRGTCDSFISSVAAACAFLAAASHFAFSFRLHRHLKGHIPTIDSETSQSVPMMNPESEAVTGPVNNTSRIILFAKKNTTHAQITRKRDAGLM